MRKYKDHPWKEDKVKCVLILRSYDIQGEEIKDRVRSVYVTRNAEKKMTSDAIRDTLPVGERFKYNYYANMKIAIPRRVFEQILLNSAIDTFFTTIVGKTNLIGYDRKTRIKKELWLDPESKECILYFRNGLLLKIGE